MVCRLGTFAYLRSDNAVAPTRRPNGVPGHYEIFNAKCVNTGLFELIERGSPQFGSGVHRNLSRDVVSLRVRRWVG
jgi:hypothetical protein